MAGGSLASALLFLEAGEGGQGCKNITGIGQAQHTLGFTSVATKKFPVSEVVQTLLGVRG